MSSNDSPKKLENGGRSLIMFMINAAVMLLCIMYLHPLPMNNDDMIIHFITSGVYGTASPGLATSNIILGYILSIPSRLIPTLNWVTIYEFAILFLAFTIGSSIIWSKNPNFPGFCLAVGFILIAAPGMYCNFHNTKSVIFCSAVGLIAVLYSIVDDTPGWAVSGALLSFMASIMRFTGFLPGAAFAFVPCAVTFFRIVFTKYKGHIGDAIRMVIVFIVVLGLVFGAQYADGILAAKNDEISFYREYNQLRGIVSDYSLPDYYEHADEYRAIGITANDIKIINQWNFADLEKYDIDTLRQLSDLVKSQSRSANGIFTGITDTFMTALKQDYDLGAALILIIICLFVSSREDRLSLLLTPIMFIGCAVFLSLNGRTTRWVGCGMSAAMLMAVLYCFNIEEKKIKRTAVCLAAAACAALCAVFVMDREIITYRTAYRTDLKNTMSGLSEDSDSLYLLDITAQPDAERAQPPFEAFGRDLYRNIYPLGGWDTMSPAKNAVLKRFDIDPKTESPYRALAERSNVFLADNNDINGKLTLIRESMYPRANASVLTVINGTYIWAFSPDNFDIKAPADDGNISEPQEIDDAITENAVAQQTKINENGDEAKEKSYPTIIEFAKYDDTVFSSYVFYGITADRSLLEYDRIFIEITSESGAVNTYRMAAMEDYPEKAQMRLPDIWSSDEITSVRLIVENNDTVMSSPYYVKQDM